MRMFVATIVFSLLTALPSQAAGIRPGMTRTQVEEALGAPNAVLNRNGREVLLYPQNGRVELAGDAVVELENVAVDNAPASASEPAQTPSPLPPSATLPPRSEPAVGPAQSPAKNLAPSPPSSPPSTTAEAREKKFLEDNGFITTAPIALPPGWKETASTARAPASKSRASSLGTLLLVGGLCRIAIMIVVLKFAFHWADVHADWSQMVVPALADTLFRTVIILIANYFFGTTELFYADEAVAYLVLIFVLMKTTHACTLPRALAVAGASKLVSMVLSSLLSAALLAKLAR